ncbi:Glucose transporter type 1 [Nymphon striatum]|nr:Glucose transporter type 1 [Nymphon striatum]
MCPACTNVWVRDLGNYRYPVEKIGKFPTQYGKEDPRFQFIQYMENSSLMFLLVEVSAILHTCGHIQIRSEIDQYVSGEDIALKVIKKGLVVAIFSAVLGMFQFGYNTGVINSPIKLIETFIEDVYIERRTDVAFMKSGLRTFLGSVVVSIFAIGGMIGGFTGGFIANKFGRKRGLMLNQFAGIVGAVLMGFSKHSRSFEMLIIGRFFIGYNCGLNTILVPMYISEISTANLRGGLGTVNQLAVTIGLLLSMVLGIEPILGSEKGWPFLLGIAVFPPILQLILLPLCPESPRYLLIYLNKEEEARKALMKLHSASSVENDIMEMRAEEIAQQQEARITISELLRSQSLRLPLIIAVIIQLSQQLSGINVVFYYSTTLFSAAGIGDDAAKYCTIGVGAVMIVMTVISIPLMDRAGRRTLHLYGLGGMFIFSIFVTISLLVKFIISWLSYLAVFSVLCYVVFFAIGPGSIPWMITAELFSQGPRPAAMSIAVLVNWSANFIVGITFPPIQSFLQNYTFLPYTVLLAIFWTFTYKKVPETKGKTFEEITAFFKRGQAPETPETVISSGLKEDTEFSEFKTGNENYIKKGFDQ